MEEQVLETRITKTVRLSTRYSVEITYLASKGLRVEWHPSTPVQLDDAEIQAYRTTRNEILAEVARRVGLSIAVVEVP